jgi:hypothetical protein
VIPLDQERADHLIALAGQRFDPNLLPTELKVIHTSVSDDPQIQEVQQSQQPVRPEFLRWLATDKDAADLIDAKGIRVFSATIQGQLDLSFCRISPMLVFSFCTFQDELLLLHSELRGLGIYASKASKGIVAHGAVLHGPLFLRDGFESSGSVDFHSARIEASVQCTGALLLASGHALSLEAATISGDVFLTNEFRSYAEVRMLGTKIGGDLNCDGASLSPVGGGIALSLDRAQIRGNVFFINFSSSATLSLPGAEIGGQLNCRGAVFTAPNTALALDGATVQGGVDLQELKSSGELRFVGAHIFGSLNCSGAVVSATGRALSFDRASVQGSVFLRRLKSSGVVRMSNAQIEHSLDCRGATLPALYCPNMKLRGDLTWTSIENPKETQLNLATASILNLRDDKASWPSPGKLILDGLVYEQLSLHPPSSAEQLAISNLSDALPLDADERIAWLRLQSLDGRVEPQPWVQLSELFVGKGNKEGAKHVIFALRQEQAMRYSRVRRFWNVLVALLEERPSRVLWSVVTLIVLGTLVFWHGERGGAMAPTDREAYAAWANGRSFQSAYPRFNPIAYTIENALPLVRLGQDDKWAPDPSRPQMAYWLLTCVRWFLIFLGWFQATLLVAAIGSRFKP